MADSQSSGAPLATGLSPNRLYTVTALVHSPVVKRIVVHTVQHPKILIIFAAKDLIISGTVMAVLTIINLRLS